MFSAYILCSCNTAPSVIVLDKYTQDNNGRWYFSVLIKNASENSDSLKQYMISYYRTQEEHLKSLDTSYYIGGIDFYRYTRSTSYFIDNNEDPGGWSSRILTDCEKDKIGFIVRDSKRENKLVLIFRNQSLGTQYIDLDN